MDHIVTTLPETVIPIRAAERNAGLDLLKIIACFAVVVLHVTGNVPMATAGYSIHNTLYYIAGLAVPVFFMVNGYLLLNKASLSYRYVLKKILNILLIVFSWNVLLFLEKLIIEGKMINPFRTALSSLMQGDYFWQFWFFGSLILIYSVLPVIHRFFRNIKSAMLITGIFTLLCIAVDITNIVRGSLGLAVVQSHIPQTFRLWTWLAYYLLGGLLGKKQITDYVQKHLKASINWLIFIAFIIVISIYQYNTARLFKDARAEMFYDNIFTFIYVTSLFILICRQNFSKFKNAVSELISKNVMGVYIIHVTVLLQLTRYYKFNTPLTNICLIFIVFSLSLISSIIISRIPIVKRLINI